jgi:hypothetical protein
LEDQNQKVRVAALEGLQALGPDAMVAVPQLARMLEDPDWVNIGQVIMTLGAIGPAAASVGPKLLKLLESIPPGLQSFFGSRPTNPDGSQMAADFWYQTVIRPSIMMALPAMGYEIAAPLADE